MSVVAYVSYHLLANYLGEKLLWVRLVEAFVPIGLAGVTFLLAARILKISELETVYAAAKRKLGRS
jgi:uncharacterized membrane protein YuzA (DUF378 family)